ncbi:Serine/Threonine kinase domain protein (macronuclear) [Tetrahymena thermophila SB210]|uniref:Serine/Threonine kinase domain protein n=1 Tax=Tetrahymena thermophila (strain SB210) TaxID=312017 RepID=Q24I57_TETTS|nr:Serine/Threonine kinase domain protein [Tetrahymena thermophila SB210]EAS07381.2 Serine/Threonine kinase domain protein [Tetrahymena thermophila SB210]|eukprot:XP_001027623.2 Serine/Threonine kinase domain protein [Tetrahymena thermophila SB210]
MYFQNVIEFQPGKLLNNRYFIDKKLGEGSFGRVYKALDQKSNEVVAIKQYLIKGFIDNPKLQQLFNQELKILKQLNSKHVIRYIDDFSNSDSHFLVLEYCNQGDLGQLLTRKKDKKENISEQEVIGYFKQILSGLQELHKHLVVHRDLKLDNILISQNCLKIADFGFAKSFDNTKEVTLTTLGTQTNMAPEVLEEKPYGMEVDVYSLGVLLYQLLYGYLPYRCDNYDDLKRNIKKSIQNINFDDPSVKISKEMRNLLQRMICYDRRQRIRWDQIYQHELLQQDSQANSIVLPGSIMQMPNHKQEAIDLYRKFKNLMITDENTELKEVDAKQYQKDLNLSTISEVSSSRSDDSNDYQQLKKKIEEQEQTAKCIEDTIQKYEQYKLKLIQIFQTFMHNCQIVKTIRNRIIQLALAKQAYMMASNISKSLKNDQNFFKVQYFEEFLKLPFYQQIKAELIQSEMDFERLYLACKQEIQQTLQNLCVEQQKKEKLIMVINEEINQKNLSNNIPDLINLGIANSYSNINSDLDTLKNLNSNLLAVYYQSFILVSGCLKQESLFKQEDFNLSYYILNIKKLSLEESKKQFDELINELNIKQIKL